jgi:hypothetical protein
VIRFPFDFQDGSGIGLKRFLVIGHRLDSAILIKTTSKTGHYKARPELLMGVVLCAANQYEPFEEETVIDPANAFAVPHHKLEKFHNAYSASRRSSRFETSGHPGRGGSQIFPDGQLRSASQSKRPPKHP